MPEKPHILSDPPPVTLNSEQAELRNRVEDGLLRPSRLDVYQSPVTGKYRLCLNTPVGRFVLLDDCESPEAALDLGASLFLDPHGESRHVVYQVEGYPDSAGRLFQSGVPLAPIYMAMRIREAIRRKTDRLVRVEVTVLPGVD
jgi:hypothetical protein